MTKSVSSVPIKYSFDVEYGNFPVEELKKEGKGGADAVIFMPCYKRDDEYTPTLFSGKGENQRLDSKELYNAWLHMGKEILLKSALSGEFLVAMTQMSSLVKVLEDTGHLEEVMKQVNTVVNAVNKGKENEEQGSVQESNEGENLGNAEG